MWNKDVIKLWTDTLRNPGEEYHQATGTLERCEDNPYDPNEKKGFCCLGVLSHLAHKEGVTERREVVARFGEPRRVEYGTNGNWSSGSLPISVMRWAGVEVSDPFLNGFTASHQNDLAKKSFAEIADLIDAEMVKQRKDALKEAEQDVRYSENRVKDLESHLKAAMGHVEKTKARLAELKESVEVATDSPEDVEEYMEDD